MYSYQGQIYTSLQEVPAPILSAFIQQNVLTETLLVQAGKPLFWEEHYLRLMASMRILRMEIPLTFTLEHLAEKIEALTTRLGHETFSGKIHLSVVKMAEPTVSQPIPATAYSISGVSSSDAVFSYQKASLPTDLYKDHFLAPGLFSSIESAAQQWRNMAWTFVHENSYCDGILLNTEKHLVESLQGSLFLVKGNQISTPAIGQGVRKTVYRNQLLTVLDKNPAFEITEEIISPFSLQKADELFVLCDAHGILSIPQYRKKKFKTTATEEISTLFMAHINAQV